MKIIIACGLILAASFSHAQCNDKASAIAQAIYENTNQWSSVSLTMTMNIRSKKGKANEYKIDSIQMKDGDIDKKKLVFSSPQSIKGTSILSHSKGSDEKQWMFTPKTKKIQRILGKQRSRSFAGSQYTFEDLSSFQPSNYFFRWVSEEACGSDSCQVIISYPEYKGSYYSKLKSWVDSQSRVQKIEYYGHNGEHLKTLTIERYEKLSSDFWWPMISNMMNHKNGKSTELTIESVEENIELNPSRFNEKTLNVK